MTPVSRTLERALQNVLREQFSHQTEDDPTAPRVNVSEAVEAVFDSVESAQHSLMLIEATLDRIATSLEKMYALTLVLTGYAEVNGETEKKP